MFSMLYYVTVTSGLGFDQGLRELQVDLGVITVYKRSVLERNQK